MLWLIGAGVLIYALSGSNSIVQASTTKKNGDEMWWSTLPKKNLTFFGNPDNPKKVSIRAGHSIYNDGAKGGDMSENPYTFDIATRIAKALSPYCYVMVTRRDYRKQYGAETRTVNKFNPACDIQVHLNHAKSKKASGVLSMYWKHSKKGGHKLAKLLTAAVRNAIGLKTTYSHDGTVGLPSEGFQKIQFMVKNPKPVSVIMELFFVSNPNDRAAADEEHEKNAIATETASAILQFMKGQK